MTQTATITWHRIDDMPPPSGRILIADAADRIVRPAMCDVGRTPAHTIIHAAGYPATGLKWWTHWAEMPAAPRMDDV